MLLLGLGIGLARAQPAPPPPPANFFTDHAGVVSADVAARIEHRLRDLEKESTNQLLVVVEKTTPPGYASMEEYTNRTAEAWRVGDRSRDNGAVLFVFVADRRVRIEVGYGLEGALPDALASRIIREEITPRFREGRYGEGLLAGVDSIARATRGEYRPAGGAPAAARKVVILLVVLLLFFMAVLVPFWREILEMREYRTYSGRGSSGGRLRRGGHWGGGWSGGGGSSWGGGGGGFSGGGGSFGGGGASGSW